jgi:hypothetical protein
MPRIKIKDLSKDLKISKAEMEKITGGVLTKPESFTTLPSFDFGDISADLTGCGCRKMADDPKEAGC